MEFILKEALSGIGHRLIAGDEDVSFAGIKWDSRKVTSGDMFIAVIGGGTDGHRYIEKAISLGASVVVCDNKQDVLSDDELVSLSQGKVTILAIDDTRTGMAKISANMYDHPEQAIKLYGITGTKGKTTSAFMLHSILSASGSKTGLMGTVCNLIGDKREEAVHTTPEAPVTYEFLSRLSRSGFDSCVMEVSSLGLKLERVCGMKYEVGCFTNLYSDHIGGIEHPDMEDYFASKLLIFDHCYKAAVNADSARIDEIRARADECGVRTVYYGIDNDADIMAKNLRFGSRDNINGTIFDIVINHETYPEEVFVPIPGRFNVYNALCAITAAYLEGLDLKTSIKALAGVRVPGRLEPVDNRLGLNILVDYAHNGEALSNVIETAKEFTSGRVITLFGCGGDRPSARRTEMGKVAGEMSDLTVITSDNPRTEDPMAIINDILMSINNTNGLYEVEPDRSKAIFKAVSEAREGDTVLIAGKGHETYQEINGVKHHFDDHEKAAQAVAEIEKLRGFADL
ncbi:MAG: UDP-N-acetylmuramoyl-L-alanyl-D-glutamate--2,6-diaminopimelate ligase [Clostridiales bacterium]|nr:UDP-N-acetylmuramoyl-L-alanyl-D-glutamate--2,6-diaminopimelate ligase [Clostridiales bacterium]